MSGRAAKAIFATVPPAGAPVFELEDHIFYLFTQIFGRRNRHLIERLKPLGVTVANWRVLAVLHERAGATMNQLADLTTIDRTTLTRTLDRMVRDRMVARRPDPRDRRSTRLWLTSRGNETFRRILPIIVEQNDRATRGLAGSDLGRFRGILHRMVRNLDPDYDVRNAVWLRRGTVINNRRPKGDAS